MDRLYGIIVEDNTKSHGELTVAEIYNERYFGFMIFFLPVVSTELFHVFVVKFQMIRAIIKADEYFQI